MSTDLDNLINATDYSTSNMIYQQTWTTWLTLQTIALVHDIPTNMDSWQMLQIIALVHDIPTNMDSLTDATDYSTSIWYTNKHGQMDRCYRLQHLYMIYQQTWTAWQMLQIIALVHDIPTNMDSLTDATDYSTCTWYTNKHGQLDRCYRLQHLYMIYQQTWTAWQMLQIIALVHDIPTNMDRCYRL